MKMPTKTELLKLQEMYHTDRRIAEALGGNVTEHLVQYWRRKKGIPRRKFAKYSESQIRELWERFGDDFRCGRELGLSKAGFYSWRRRYNIMEKPRALRLEQLELRFGSEPKIGRDGVFVEYYRTVGEKILAKNSNQNIVESGQEIEISPDAVIVDYSIADSMPKLRISKSLAPRVWIISRGRSLGQSGSDADVNYCDSPYSILQGEGILPNQLILTNSGLSAGLSALSSLILQVNREELNKVLRSDRMKIKVPAVIRLTLQGRLQKSVTAFDIFCFAISNLPHDVLKGRIIEYSGNITERLNIYERISLCHLTPHLGAVCGYTLFDEITRKFISGRNKSDHKVLFSDSKAYYEREYVLTISGLEPQLIHQDSPRLSKRLRDFEHDEAVDTIFIGGPCGGGLDCLKQIADILRSQSVRRSARLYISPLTQDVYVHAMKKRFLMPIAEAGAVILPPGSRLRDIPGFSSGSFNTVVSTPDNFDNSGLRGVNYVSHLSAAAMSVRTRPEQPGRRLQT
jgi:hypothetical protein